MKKPESTDGPEAREKFESAMTAIFKVPKQKKQQDKPTASVKKPKSSDKD
jgi:hypothetical protein